MPANWVEHFLLPLVAGGSVEVGPPLGNATVSTILAAAEHGAPQALERARHKVAASLVADSPLYTLNEEDVRLGLVMHNLCCLQHPRIRRLSPRRRAEIHACARALLSEVPSIDSQAALIRRHTLTHRIGTIARLDTKIQFWLGEREFLGRPPPSRMMKWPRLRRVAVESQTHLLSQLLDEADRALLAALRQASPLHSLLTLSSEGEFADAVRSLRFSAIARAAVNAHRADIAKLAPLLARWTCALVQKKSAAARLAVQYLCHLHLVSLCESELGDVGDPRFTGLQDYAALFVAALDCRLVPAAATAVRPMELQLERYAASCRRLAGGRGLELTKLMAEAMMPAAPRASP